MRRRGAHPVPMLSTLIVVAGLATAAQDDLAPDTNAPPAQEELPPSLVPS